MNPILAGRILMGAIVLLIALMGGGFYQLNAMLTQKTNETKQAQAERDVANEDIKKLQNLQSILDQQSLSVERAKNLLADPKNFQDKIVNDITKYAAISGLSISSFNFTIPVAGAPVSVAPGQAAIVTPENAVRFKLSISPAQQVSYRNMLTFMKLVENSVSKLQITSVTLTPDSTNPSSLTGQTIDIDVLVRKQ